MDQGRIRVLIADDHSVVRWALRTLLQEHGIVTVGEATSLAQARELASTLKPDLVLTGFEVGDPRVVECASRWRSNYSMLVYGASDADSVDRFMSAGGMGFLPRSAPVREFITAIRSVAGGQRWISPISLDKHEIAESGGSSKPILSDREREVAALIARGLSSSQIASKLFVSLNTIETHRYRIFRKLGVHNRAALVDYALRTGLVDL